MTTNTERKQALINALETYLSSWKEIDEQTPWQVIEPSWWLEGAEAAIAVGQALRTIKGDSL